jgi:lipoprotein-releasing system permease protein
VPFEVYIALRYLREARFQTLLILAAVAVGVGVVVFLSALINGLQDNLLATTLGSQPHVVVTRVEEPPVVLPDPSRVVAALVEQPPARELILHDWAKVQRELRTVPGVVAVAAVASGPGLATRGEASKTIAIRGIVPEDYDRIVSISDKLRSGRFMPSSDQVLIGTELARDLGIGIGEKFRIETTTSRPSTFSVAGIFDLGSKDVNRRWVLTSLRVGQSLLDMPGGVTSLEIRTGDVFAADDVATAIAARTGLRAESWIKLNQQLMTGLKSQNSSRYIIEFFVVVAVALGIASVLLVAVVQKSKEIGIMRAFGTSDRQVIGVFLLQGAILGSIGSVGGSALGAALALSFQTLARNPDGSPTFPVAVTVGLLASTALLAIGVGIAAAAFPAWRATRLDPATVIRYG